MFYNFTKRLYLRVWKKINSRHGNVHGKCSNAYQVKLPYTNQYVFVRGTKSDVSRVDEFLNSIYFQKSYLLERLKRVEPTVLVDLGANIGLSSLAFAREFESLKFIFAVEAEKENFGVLSKNFELWNELSHGTTFMCENAVASNASNMDMQQASSLHELTGKNSASGTFMFEAGSDISNTNAGLKSIAMPEILGKFPDGSRVIVKIDIEGGERLLFEDNFHWLNCVHYLTLEIHDRFHEDFLYSSSAFLNALNTANFAIHPSEDVLHCFNRTLLFDDQVGS